MITWFVKKTKDTWTVKYIEKPTKEMLGNLNSRWFGDIQKAECYVQTESYSPSQALALGEYYIDR